MTYVVTDNCIMCKYTDCVEVCPVDCFYEGENMLIINSSECIDCGACEPVCPAQAIVPEKAGETDAWIEVARSYEDLWPNLTRKKPEMASAESMLNVPDKFSRFFSPKPGSGKADES